MPKQEVTRTPDKIKGLERASQALARVFDYNLARQQQQERQQQVLQQIQQEQQFKQALQQQEIEAAQQRLNKDLTFRREVEDRLREKAEEERRLRNLERRSRDMFKTEELSLRRKEIEALNRLRQAQAQKYQQTKDEETITNSLMERIRTLNTMSRFPLNPAVQTRAKTILNEIRVYQNALDQYRLTGEIPKNLGEQLSSAVYGSISGLPPNLNALQTTAQGPESQERGTKPLEEMSVDELINAMNQ